MSGSKVAVKYFPLFSMELFGWYLCAPELWRCVWKLNSKQIDKAQMMAFMQRHRCHRQPLQVALHTRLWSNHRNWRFVCRQESRRSKSHMVTKEPEEESSCLKCGPKMRPRTSRHALRTMWTLTMNRLVLPKAIRYLVAFDLTTKKVKSTNINCTGQTAKKASDLWRWSAFTDHRPTHHGKWTCIYVESLWSTDHSKHFYNSSHSQPPGQALLGRKLLVSPFQCRKQIQSATQILPTIADKMGPGGQRYPSGIFALSRLPQQQQKNFPPTRGTR